MEEAQKAAETEMARVQRRLEAQLADLRATGSRLEVDLLKVGHRIVSVWQDGGHYVATTYTNASARQTRARRKSFKLLTMASRCS